MASELTFIADSLWFSVKELFFFLSTAGAEDKITDRLSRNIGGTLFQ